VWDRGELLPALDKLFGPVAVMTVLAHDMGHAVQARLGVDPATPELVLAQQADCYTGAFIRWVVDGDAEHFRLSTGDGLNEVLSTMMFLRDQVGPVATDAQDQGSSFDRVTAFQFGFSDGPVRCDEIDPEEVRHRVTELGFSPASEANDNVPVDGDTMALLTQSLNAAFKQGDRSAPPRIVANTGTCADGTGTAPASFCPRDNTIAVDEAALNQLAALPADGQVGPADPEQSVANPPDPGPVGSGLGDFAAFAEVASRYALAVQRSLGIPLDDKNTGLRTACLTGAWAGVIRHETSRAGGQQLLLGPGDLDEAVAELLSPTSVIATDIHGALVPAGFARVSSFQDGFLQGSTVCTAQFG
jgi:predicted metalloprotease